MDVDEILEKIGNFGKYQKILLGLLCLPVTFALPFTFMGQLFQAIIPHHWCLVPQLMQLSADQRKSLAIPIEIHDNGETFSNCYMYNYNYSKLTERYGDTGWTAKHLKEAIQQVQQSNNSVIRCTSGWEYDFQTFRPTASSDWDWVCDDDWKPYVSLAIFFIGSSFGALLFGYISDRYGRAPTALMSNALACLASLATAFTQEFISFSVIRFFAGLTFDLCHLSFYILVMEYIAADRRTICSNLSLGIFFTAGSVLLPCLAYLLPNWRYFSMITAIPFALLLPFFKYIPESARWLLVQNRADDAINQLKTIAKINKKELKEEIWEEAKKSMIDAANFEKKKKKYNYIDLFRTPKMRQRTIIMTCMWFIVMMSYDGLVRNTENLEWDVFLSSILGNATELPASLIPMLLMDRIGRKFTSILNFLLGAIFCLSVLAVPFGMAWLFVALAVLARLMITVMMNVLILYQAELFPTAVRAQGLSFVHLMGFVGSMASPFIVYLGHYRREYPLIIFGSLSIVGAMLTLFLPETLYEALPETLEDGEHFGVQQSVFYFPKRNLNIFPAISKDNEKPIFSVENVHKQQITETRLATYL